MKTAIILIAALAVGFGAGWFSKPVPITEPDSPQGGAEVAIPEPEPVKAGEYVFPIAAEDYKMKTSAFGVRVSPILHVEKRHIGLDICGIWQAQVVAVADGVVVNHWLPPGTKRGGKTYEGHKVYGGMIHVLHDDGAESIYAHLSRTYVREEQRVRAGQVIGRQGKTGMAKGEHLHFELLIDGEPVNPILYLPDMEEGRR